MFLTAAMRVLPALEVSLLPADRTGAESNLDLADTRRGSWGLHDRRRRHHHRRDIKMSTTRACLLVPPRRSRRPFRVELKESATLSLKGPEDPSP